MSGNIDNNPEGVEKRKAITEEFVEIDGRPKETGKPNVQVFLCDCKPPRVLGNFDGRVLVVIDGDMFIDPKNQMVNLACNKCAKIVKDICPNSWKITITSLKAQQRIM